MAYSDNKFYDISEVIVFVGPCCSGKSTISTFASNSPYERLDVDSLIKYLGFVCFETTYEEIYESLEEYVHRGEYKVYDFGGSTLSQAPQEYREKIFNLFKGAKVYNVRPSKSNDISFNFLKRLIMDEKNTPQERKLELIDGVKYDLQSGVLESFQTEPTIYTLDRIKSKKNLLNPLTSASNVKREYRRGLINLAQELKVEIFDKGQGQLGE